MTYGKNALKAKYEIKNCSIKVVSVMICPHQVLLFAAKDDLTFYFSFSWQGFGAAAAPSGVEGPAGPSKENYMKSC